MEKHGVANWAVIGIFLILFVHMLKWAGNFLIPLTAAMLGFLVILPIERWLTRRMVPSALTAASVTLGLGAVISFVLLTVSTPILTLIDDLPRMIDNLRYDMANMGGETIEKIEEATEAAAEILEGEDEPQQTTITLNEEAGSMLAPILSRAPALGAQLVLTLVLLFFMIASGASFLRKLVIVAPNLQEKRKAVLVVNTIAEKLGVYLGGITMINAGLGIAIGLAMWLLGLPNPIMFGFIAFAFNFVPFLGAIAGASLAGIVGYGEFGDPWDALIIFLIYMALTNFEGQFVTPYVLSGRLKLNPPIVFATVAFFAWIWSVIGMVVAVPILIAAKIILDEIPSTRGIGIFLGGDEEELEEANVKPSQA